ncbi:MAG: hypothetical protein Q9165_004171 [Trypethelium subeluteriae]
MDTRPNHLPPQKLRQARAAFRKSGGQPRLSDQEYRELQRGAELQERANKIKESERRKKLNRQKRAEKEQEERQTKRQRLLEDQKKGKLFLGSTQFPRSQFRIEKFITGLDGTREEIKVAEKLEESIEPWDEDDVDDVSLLEVLNTCEASTESLATLPRPTEKRRRLQSAADDFDLDYGPISTQDFAAINLELPQRPPVKPCIGTGQTARQQDRELTAPSSACSQPSSKRPAPLSSLGICTQDLDLLALAQFEPS